jgi:hypothetical protein
MRSALEKRGDHPKRANATSEWFAISPRKWLRLVARTNESGRGGPTLIVKQEEKSHGSKKRE